MRKLAALFALLPALSFGQTLFGVGVTASSLGAGIQGAVSVTQNSNVRAGFNIFDFGDNFSKDGINYAGELKLRSVQITYDQFFGGRFFGFHVSPGALIYDGNKGSANLSVPSGQSFTLGGATYYSGQSASVSPFGNSVSGSGSLTFPKAAPMILIGFGNFLPRGQKHFGLSFDAGVVFQGSPNVRLNLSGLACPNSQQILNCVNVASDPGVQANLQAEQARLNHDVNGFRFYPVVSLVFSYKF